MTYNVATVSLSIDSQRVDCNRSILIVSDQSLERDSKDKDLVATVVSHSIAVNEIPSLIFHRPGRHDDMY